MATLGNIITGLTMLVFIGGSGACDTGSMLGCVEGFSKYQGGASAVFEKYTKAQLQDVCRLFREANTCMNRALNGCPSQASTAWSGIEDAFQYLCSDDGSAGYLKHADCWGNAALKRQSQSCNSSYQSSVKDMTSSYQNNGYSSQQEFFGDVCIATNRFLQCIYESVETTCGVEAADWQLKMTMKAVTPASGLIQCTLDRSGSGACDTGSMPGCMAGFSKYQGGASAVVDKYTKTELQDVCRIFRETNTCMNRALNGCPSQARTAWSGVEDAFQYLCSDEGSAGYLKHADCWGNAALKRQGQSCNSSYQSSVKDMVSSYQNNGYSSQQEFFGDVCIATNRFLQCIYESVETTCGVEAADWQLKMTMKAVTPASGLMQCTPDRTNDAETLSSGRPFLWILASLLVYGWSRQSI